MPDVVLKFIKVCSELVSNDIGLGLIGLGGRRGRHPSIAIPPHSPVRL